MELETKTMTSAELQRELVAFNQRDTPQQLGEAFELLRSKYHSAQKEQQRQLNKNGIELPVRVKRQQGSRQAGEGSDSIDDESDHSDSDSDSDRNSNSDRDRNDHNDLNDHDHNGDNDQDITSTSANASYKNKNKNSNLLIDEPFEVWALLNTHPDRLASACSYLYAEAVTALPSPSTASSKSHNKPNPGALARKLRQPLAVLCLILHPDILSSATALHAIRNLRRIAEPHDKIDAIYLARLYHRQRARHKGRFRTPLTHFRAAVMQVEQKTGIDIYPATAGTRKAKRMNTIPDPDVQAVSDSDHDEHDQVHGQVDGCVEYDDSNDGGGSPEHVQGTAEAKNETELGNQYQYQRRDNKETTASNGGSQEQARASEDVTDQSDTPEKARCTATSVSPGFNVDEQEDFSLFADLAEPRYDDDDDDEDEDTDHKLFNKGNLDCINVDDDNADIWPEDSDCQPLSPHNINLQSAEHTKPTLAIPSWRQYSATQVVHGSADGAGTVSEATEDDSIDAAVTLATLKEQARLNSSPAPAPAPGAAAEAKTQLKSSSPTASSRSNNKTLPASMSIQSLKTKRKLDGGDETHNSDHAAVALMNTPSAMLSRLGCHDGTSAAWLTSSDISAGLQLLLKEAASTDIKQHEMQMDSEQGGPAWRGRGGFGQCYAFDPGFPCIDGKSSPGQIKHTKRLPRHLLFFLNHKGSHWTLEHLDCETSQLNHFDSMVMVTGQGKGTGTSTGTDNHDQAFSHASRVIQHFVSQSNPSIVVNPDSELSFRAQVSLYFSA